MDELSSAVVGDVAAAAPADDAIAHEPVGAPAPVAAPCTVRVVDDLIGVLIDDDAPWAIADYEIVQGDKYITVDFKDSQFKRFVFGGVRKAADNGFLARFRKLRGSETVKNLLGVHNIARGSAYATKKQKKWALQSVQMNPVVTVPLPRIVYGYNAYGPISISTKASLKLKDKLVVLFSGRNMEYIKYAMLCDSEDTPVKKRQQPEFEGVENVCKWNKTLKCFVAFRKNSETGHLEYKTIKPIYSS